MNIVPKKTFLEGVEKITDPTTKAEIKQAVLAVKEAESIKDIPELKKLKGDKRGISYRIKVGDWRMGVTIVGDLVTFLICKPRKDIYKFFP